MVEHHRIGQQFGNYRLERLLGRGGFAEVYVGIHLRLQRPAAIKILHTHLSGQESAAFQREAQIIAGLNHPHIVRVLDFDVQQGIPFLVMDYLPHGTVRQRHPRGERIPLPTILSYVIEVAQALQYAHEQRLIHRDVKPENMLIGQRGEIVLSDFGIAAIAHNTTSRTAQEAIGTVPYMAPEQIQAQARAASDQYALGVVVYEWLVGERPFEGSFTEIFAKHLMMPPPPLHVKLPTLPKTVEQVIFRALAKDPGERFPDIMTFATTLQEAIQDGTDRKTDDEEANRSHNLPMPHALLPTPMLKARSIQTPPVLNTEAVSSPVPTHIQDIHSTRASVPSSKERPIKAAPEEKKSQSHKVSRRNVIISTGIGLVAAGAGTAWWFLSPYSFDALIYRGHSWSVTAVAWSPDSKRIASATDAFNGVHVWDATTSYHLFTYTGHAKTSHADPLLTSIAWSPDGKRIASGDDKTVHVWDAADGGHPFIYQQEGPTIGSTSVAWSPDSKRIASAGQSGVHVWNAVDGSHLFVYTGHATDLLSEASQAVWSPDGKRIASHGFGGPVHVWDAADGGHPFVYKRETDTGNAMQVTWSPDGKRIASGSSDGTVQVWDSANGNHLFIYKGHSHYITSVAWSPNASRIASASGNDKANSDKTVHVWDAADGGHLFTYKGHSASVLSVAWSPDGKRIASGSNDHTVRVWNAQ